MSEKNLKVTELRKIVFAEMNVAVYRQKVFADLLAELDGRQAEATEEETVVETKTATKTKSKSKPVAAPVEEVETEVEAEEDDMFGDDAEVDQGPTLEDVRKVVKDFATKHGKEKALKLLGKFKVTSIPDIKKTDYAKVIELAKKHL